MSKLTYRLKGVGVLLTWWAVVPVVAIACGVWDGVREGFNILRHVYDLPLAWKSLRAGEQIVSGDMQAAMDAFFAHLEEMQAAQDLADAGGTDPQAEAGTRG